MIEPETGEPALREEYQYSLISLARVFVDPEDELRVKVSDKRRKSTSQMRGRAWMRWRLRRMRGYGRIS